MTTSALKPTSDVVKTGVTGVGSTTSLFQNVDDGTAFASADNDTTYVHSGSNATAVHRVGYSGGPAGVVTQLVTNYRARTNSASGTAQIKVYDGNTLVKTGAVKTLSSTYQDFTETFTGLTVANVNNLRTELTLKRTSGTGHVRYTMTWISATIDNSNPTVSITSPATGSTVRGTVNISASAADDAAVTKVEFLVDGKVRGTDTSSPFSFRWDSFHDTFDSRSTRAHVLTAKAYDAAGHVTTSSNVSAMVVPAAAGDCNGDGVVNSADITAIGSEISDGDGTGAEGTAGGTFAGNPGCDANEDNVVDSADQTCAQSIINSGPTACLDMNGPLVKPIIFKPTDFTVDQATIDFVKNKIQETRRFYAKNGNGKTFRALPLEVVNGQSAHAAYWIDGSNYEFGVLQELQNRGYPAHVDWTKTPWNRVVWVWGLGAGAWAGAHHYPTGSGFGMVGDAVLYAGMDLNCSRVTEPLPSGNGTVAACNDWLNSGQIYGFGVGAFIHELGHTFTLEHPAADQFPFTVMGGHWNYPNTGLITDDKNRIAASHMFPGFSDPTAPTVAVLNPAPNAAVSGIVSIRGNASDNHGIRAMHLYIDNVEVTSLPPLSSPTGNDLEFAYDWDTGPVATGSHTIKVSADDVGGKSSSSTITVSKGGGGGGGNCSAAPWSSSTTYQLNSIATANCTAVFLSCSSAELNHNFAWKCVGANPGWCNQFQPGTNQNYNGIWQQLEQCN